MVKKRSLKETVIAIFENEIQIKIIDTTGAHYGFSFIGWTDHALLKDRFLVGLQMDKHTRKIWVDILFFNIII